MEHKLSTIPHQTSQPLIGLEQVTTPKTLQVIRCWGWRLWYLYSRAGDRGRLMVQAVIRHPLNVSTRVPSRDFVFWRTKCRLVFYRFPMWFSFHKYSIVIFCFEVTVSRSTNGTAMRTSQQTLCPLENRGIWRNKDLSLFFEADFRILTPYC